MQILEGQAYFPEILVTKIVSRVAYTESYPEKRRFMDDGTDGGQELTNETILAGRPVGNSNFAKNNIKIMDGVIKQWLDMAYNAKKPPISRLELISSNLEIGGFFTL